MIRFKNELNKKFFLLTLIGLISILLVVSISTVNAAKNVTIKNTTNVSDINNFFNADGVIDNKTLGVGDTVIFKKGVYTDLSFSVGKSVNIKGENATFITTDKCIITINANRVNITGIKFITRTYTLGDNHGVYISGEYNIIRNCTFEDSGITGSEVMSSLFLMGSFNNVTNCTIKLVDESSIGIFMIGDHNRISDSKIETASSGIYAASEYSTIINCTIKSMREGISLGGDSTVSGCIIESSGINDPELGAIMIYNNNRILNNKITVLNSSKGSGIFIMGSNI